MKKPFCLAFAIIAVQSLAQKNIRLPSPDGNIVFLFQLASGKALYNVSFKGNPVILNSPLSLVFADGDFSGANIKINKPAYREASEIYDLVVGKTKHVNDRFKEITIPLQQTTASNRKINLIVRAFNDGLAFCYEFPKQQNWDSYILKEENTTFNLAGDPKAHALILSDYTSSHEGLYTSVLLSKIKENALLDVPVMFEFPGNIHLVITEAALLDYAGMYLSKRKGLLTSNLSPLPKESQVKVKATLPHRSPWRVLLLSDRVGALIESTIITSLNEPLKIKDVSWIKPGKTTWPWWNGNIVPDTSFAPGLNFETHKYYIDFCARNGLEYHSVTDYGTHEWYVNDGAGLVPGPNVNAGKPVPGLDMKQVIDYAKQKRVGIRVWVYWSALFPRPLLDSVFATYERWGVSGMMIDFMDRDDQEMVNMQTEMLVKAAEHHLHVQFHGAYKPTGIVRTYPNELTREGTYNYEVNKWTPGGLSPDHDIIIPFTRMIAGPTDYHMGGFRAIPQSKFKVQFTRPLMLGTRCHMLGMYVILESYLGMVADYPDAYTGQPGFEFVKEVPTVWDETKVLDAKVGEYLIIARKKNEDWYVGAITNHEARQLTIPFTFLNEGMYTAEIYTDAPDVNEEPNHLIKQVKTVGQKDVFSINLASGGGAAIHFRK